MNDRRGYACPCCNFLTRSEKDFGTYEVCPVCSWEDDFVQIHNPNLRGGANDVSLNEAKKNFGKYGAIEKEKVPEVRNPLPMERPFFLIKNEIEKPKTKTKTKTKKAK